MEKKEMNFLKCQPVTSCNGFISFFYWSGVTISIIPNQSLGLVWILFFRRVDFVWGLMSNSGLLRIKNKQKTPYKKQKTASSI